MRTLRAAHPPLDPASAPLESLLIDGGDPRLLIDAVTLLNRYGCGARPSPEQCTFSSSTATNISHRGFAAAAAMHQRLIQPASPNDLAENCNQQAEWLRHQLRAALQLDPSIEIVFSPSGTDSEIHALFIARTMLDNSSPAHGSFVNVIVAADETGSGVPQAALGHHFSSATAQGLAVHKGQQIPGFPSGTANIAIHVRERDGALRSQKQIETEVVTAVAQSVASGKRVILHVMDCSKFGWRGPALDCLRHIQKTWASSVQIVVDACQLRTARQRLACYLNHGFLVLITGSKFFAGPPFSGALLVPSPLSSAMQQIQVEQIQAVPAGLHLYTNRSDWPVRWQGIRSNLPVRPNIGQLLRWAAAVEELRAYFAAPSAFRSLALQLFSSTAERLLLERPNLHLLPDCHPADTSDDEEMSARTIFPFFVRRSGKLLSIDDCGLLYRALNRDVSQLLPRSANSAQRQTASTSCRLGQPVPVTGPARQAAGTLRLSASARLVSDTWCATDAAASLANLNRYLEPVRLILDKLDLLVENLDALKNPAATAQILPAPPQTFAQNLVAS